VLSLTGQQHQLLCSGSSKFAPLVERFSTNYEARYPDNPNASKNKTTDDVRELDEFIIYLSENMPCPHNVRYRAGLYPLITFSLSGSNSMVTTWEHWIKHDNRALTALLPRVNMEYAQVMKELFPS
jgi:hypothetical protein